MMLLSRDTNTAHSTQFVNACFEERYTVYISQSYTVGIDNRIVPSAREITLDRKRSFASEETVIRLNGKVQRYLASFEVFVRLPTTWK
jgi:hypothetical protein